jgi:peptidoglycan/LPS O-acetylase OafA/YrhL
VISSLLLRFSVALLLVGLCFGIAMGITQDFALAPAHAHLNLVGFVIPFLAGLYYRAVPRSARGALATVQATLAIIGAVIFPVGVAAVIGIGPQYEVLAIIGALIVLASAVLFAIIVFRTSGAHAA